jgi:hypothetical protein
LDFGQADRADVDRSGSAGGLALIKARSLYGWAVLSGQRNKLAQFLHWLKES